MPVNNTLSKVQTRPMKVQIQERNMLKRTAAPLSKQPIFDHGEQHPPDDSKLAKYKWHMIMNHATPDALTRLARDPHLHEPSLDAVTSTNDITCGACMQSKLVRAAHKRTTHFYKKGEAISTGIMVPLKILGLPPGEERYFISFIDTATRYAYVALLNTRAATAKTIQTILSQIHNSTGKAPRWLITDNAGEHISDIVSKTIADMSIENIPALPYNSEENVIAERFNRTAMNAVRAEMVATGRHLQYWKWTLTDATDKYSQVPHRSTGQSPHQLWFDVLIPNFKHLFIFGKLGYVPIMNEPSRSNKYKDRGQLVRYLGREGEIRVIVETTDGSIERRWGVDFHPYFTGTRSH